MPRRRQGLYLCLQKQAPVCSRRVLVHQCQRKHGIEKISILILVQSSGEKIFTHFVGRGGWIHTWSWTVCLRRVDHLASNIGSVKRLHGISIIHQAEIAIRSLRQSFLDTGREIRVQSTLGPGRGHGMRSLNKRTRPTTSDSNFEIHNVSAVAFLCTRHHPTTLLTLQQLSLTFHLVATL